MRRVVAPNPVKTQDGQVFVAGFEPVGQGRHLVHGPHIGRQIRPNPWAQVHIHTQGPAQGLGTAQYCQHFVVLGWHQQERASVQYARCLVRQQRQHAVDRVVTVGDAFAVKAVAGLAVIDLHHGQRSRPGAVAARQLHAVLCQSSLQLLAELVSG